MDCTTPLFPQDWASGAEPPEPSNVVTYPHKDDGVELFVVVVIGEEKVFVRAGDFDVTAVYATDYLPVGIWRKWSRCVVYVSVHVRSLPD